MNFFLGIFPDKETAGQINKVVSEVEKVFEGFDIPVRWSKPDKYHMTLIYLGEKLPFYKRLFFKYKLKNFSIKRFKLRFNKVKLGISRKYKELIYMDLIEGGEEMRKLYLELRNLLNLQDEGNFIPHLTLGRVSKELTEQEYANLCRELSVVTKKLDVDKIQFFVNELKLVKSDDGEFQVLINFSDSSNIKL